MTENLTTTLVVPDIITTVGLLKVLDMGSDGEYGCMFGDTGGMLVESIVRGAKEGELAAVVEDHLVCVEKYTVDGSYFTWGWQSFFADRPSTTKDDIFFMGIPYKWGTALLQFWYSNEFYVFIELMPRSMDDALIEAYWRLMMVAIAQFKHQPTIEMAERLIASLGVYIDAKR